MKLTGDLDQQLELSKDIYDRIRKFFSKARNFDFIFKHLAHCLVTNWSRLNYIWFVNV